MPFSAKLLQRQVVAMKKTKTPRLKAIQSGPPRRHGMMRSQLAFGFMQSHRGQISLKLLLLLSLGLLVTFSGVNAMTELKDNEMSNVTGQALLQMDKGFQSAGTANGQSYDAMTFYKAGLDAEIALNLNIDKLQLGCTAGAINGQHCDIDIDNLSLSGQSWSQGRPESSAILTRPFFEFAIKNDQSKTLREVMGIRLSAEQTVGLLTAGNNDGAGNETGINSLSGYMTTTPVSGTAQTLPANIGGPGDPLQTALTISTNINALGISGDLTVVTDPTQGTGIDLPSLSVDFQSAEGAVINGRRQTSTQLDVTGNVPTINFPASSNNNPTTELKADIQGCSGAICGLVGDSYTVYANQGSVSGLELAATFDESLKFIHRIEVDSPFSLSFQKESVKWPGTAAANVAQQGWWMSFEDPVELGDVSPSNPIDITQAFPQMSDALKTYFENNQLELGTEQAFTGLLAGYMNVDLPDMDLQNDVPGGTPPLSMTLQNERLQSQNVVPNCWGSARFC